MLLVKVWNATIFILGNPKKTHLGKSEGINKPMRESVELPMSPCSPSRLSLEESESHYRYRLFHLHPKSNNLQTELKLFQQRDEKACIFILCLAKRSFAGYTTVDIKMSHP